MGIGLHVALVDVTNHRNIAVKSVSEDNDVRVLIFVVAPEKPFQTSSLYAMCYDSKLEVA